MIRIAFLLAFLAVSPAVAGPPFVTLESKPKQIALSRDGRYFAAIVDTAKRDRLFVMRVWDTASGKEIGSAAPFDDGTKFGGIEFSPTADVLLAVYHPGRYGVFRLPDWKELHRQPLDGIGRPLSAIGFGPDGKWILRVVNEDEVTISEATTGEDVRSGKVAINPRYKLNADDLCISPDGKFFGTYTFDNGAEVWDATTMKRVVQYPAPVNRGKDGRVTSNSQGFYDMAFVPGQRQVVIRDSRGLHLFAFDSQKSVRTVRVEGLHVTGFLEGGRLCVIGDDFVDLRNGKKFAALPKMPSKLGGERAWLKSCLSADGSTWAAVYDGNQVRLFQTKEFLESWRAKQNTNSAKTPKPSPPKRPNPGSKPSPKPKPVAGKVDGKTMSQWFAQLQSGEATKRRAAMEALAKYGKKPVPKLIELLSHDHFSRRRRAAQALGVIGPAAKDAIPALDRALDDADERVRTYAKEALKKIRTPADRRA